MLRNENEFNDYATRKTAAQGLMDVALISANGYQLKKVLLKSEEFDFYGLILGLLIVSLVCQVFY